jgi:hypothetical protein
MGYSEKQVRFAIFAIALIYIAISFMAASYMPSGKIDPFLWFPPLALASVFILDLIVRLPAVIAYVVLFVRHLVKTHRFSGVEAPRWRSRLPQALQVALVIGRLAVSAAILFLLVFSTGVWLIGIIVSVGELLQNSFRAFIFAMVWGAFIIGMTNFLFSATRTRDRS